MPKQRVSKEKRKFAQTFQMCLRGQKILKMELKWRIFYERVENGLLRNTAQNSLYMLNVLKKYKSLQKFEPKKGKLRGPVNMREIQRNTKRRDKCP